MIDDLHRKFHHFNDRLMGWKVYKDGKQKENMGTTRVCGFRIYPNTKRQAAIGYSISTHQRLTLGQRESHA